MVFLSCAVGDCVKTFELTSDAFILHHTIRSLNAEVTCVRYNHNGKILASASIDGGICLDVASSGEILSRFFYPAQNITQRRVNSLQFSSGSRFLVTGGADGYARVWDLKTQEVKQSYHVSASPVTSVAFSGFKDDYIVAASQSGSITVYDVQTSENTGFLCVDKKFGHSAVTALQSSPHPYARNALGSVYADGSVRLWDLGSGQLSAEFVKHHREPASCLAISPVSKVLMASGGLDGRVIFFDTLQKTELRKLDLSSPVTSLSLCGDGKTLAIGTNAGEVMIYDLRSSIRPLFSSKAHDSASINFLQFATVAGTDPLHAGGLYSSNKSVSSCSSTSSTGSSAGSTSSSSTKSYSLQNGEPVQELTLRKLNPLSTLAQLASSDMITTSKCTSDTMSNSSSKTNFQIGASTGTKSNFTKSPCATTSSLDNKTTSSPAPSLSSSTAITSNKQIERHLGSPLSGPVEETNHFDQDTYGEFMDSKKDTISEERTCLKEQVFSVLAEIQEQNHSHENKLAALMKDLLQKYDVLVEENRLLRRENEQLKLR